MLLLFWQRVLSHITTCCLRLRVAIPVRPTRAPASTKVKNRDHPAYERVKEKASRFVPRRLCFSPGQAE